MIHGNDLIKFMINVVIRYYNFYDFSIRNKDIFIISKFLLILYYFLNIKKKISRAFIL